MLFNTLKQSSLVHFLLAFTFVVSGLIINVCQICTMVLWWMGQKDIYRACNIKLAYLHWALVPFISEWWANIKVNFYMNKNDFKKVNKENAIVVLNHKYDIDWLIGWVLADRVEILGNAKCMAKKSLSYLPLMGWSWRFCEYIFVKRRLEDDKKIVLPALKNLEEFKIPYWMLIFCEGTRYTKEKHKTSVAYAEKTGVKPFKHHLLPRAGGFNMLVEGLQSSAAALYDCTLCVPNKNPTLIDLLNGRSYTVEFLVRRIPLSEIPKDSENGAKFLYDLYQEKDDMFDYCASNGNFPIGEDGFDYLKDTVCCNDACLRRSECLWITIGWLSLILGTLFYYFINLVIQQRWWQITIAGSMLFGVSILFKQMMKQGAVESSSSTYGRTKKE